MCDLTQQLSIKSPSESETQVQLDGARQTLVLLTHQQEALPVALP